MTDCGSAFYFLTWSQNDKKWKDELCILLSSFVASTVPNLQHRQHRQVTFDLQLRRVFGQPPNLTQRLNER